MKGINRMAKPPTLDPIHSNGDVLCKCPVPTEVILEEDSHPMFGDLYELGNANTLGHSLLLPLDILPLLGMYQQPRLT